MQDALGNVKVGISNEAATRTLTLHNQLPATRRPLRLIHALAMRSSIAGKVERAAHRRLCYAALPRLGREWFHETPRQCFRAIRIEADYFAAKGAVVREQLMRSVRGLAAAESAARRGPKALKLTELQEAKAEAIWRNVVKYPTWEDAEQALQEQIHEDFTKWRANRMWPGNRKG